jgi:hypothetical protein
MTLSIKDINNIETDTPVDEYEYYASVQRAINGGMWSLQGSYGRTMMQAISDGWCLLGKSSARDFYGNTIPSRTEVKAGTKGSPEFVLEHRGQEWLDFLEGLQ